MPVLMGDGPELHRGIKGNQNPRYPDGSCFAPRNPKPELASPVCDECETPKPNSRLKDRPSPEHGGLAACTPSSDKHRGSS